MKTQHFLLPLLFLFTLNSCFNHFTEFGNKVLEEEVREIPYFTSITSTGNFHVFFEYSDTTEVEVVAESNLIGYIETAVFNENLKISTPSFVNIRPNYTIEVYVKGPYLDNIKLTGSGKIETVPIDALQLDIAITGSGNVFTDFYGTDLTMKITGSGDIDIYAENEYTNAVITGSGNIIAEGVTTESDYKITGSGDIKAYSYYSDITHIITTGSGNSYVYVNEELQTTISGSGNVYYKGSPYVSSIITGSGRVINRN